MHRGESSHGPSLQKNIYIEVKIGIPTIRGLGTTSFRNKIAEMCYLYRRTGRTSQTVVQRSPPRHTSSSCSIVFLQLLLMKREPFLVFLCTFFCVACNSLLDRELVPCGCCAKPHTEWNIRHFLGDSYEATHVKRGKRVVNSRSVGPNGIRYGNRCVLLHTAVLYVESMQAYILTHAWRSFSSYSSSFSRFFGTYMPRSPAVELVSWFRSVLP